MGQFRFLIPKPEHLPVILIGAAAVAFVLAIFWPARQASHIRPAVALRIAD